MYEKFQKKALSISHWNSCLDIKTVCWNSKQHSAIVFNTLQGILIEISLRHQNSIQSLANLNCIAFSKWAPNKNKENLKYWNFLWIRHENVANCMYKLKTSNFPWSDFHTYYSTTFRVVLFLKYGTWSLDNRSFDALEHVTNEGLKRIQMTL